jgi:RNA polymerase sigma-70 factor (ECF subfamily)
MVSARELQTDITVAGGWVDDEEQLVELARARSAEAWTVIYDRHYEAVHRYVRARVFDADLAADLASSVFAAAIKGVGSYRYTGRPILAWLYRIARNTVADHQRETLGRKGIGRFRAVLGVFQPEKAESQSIAGPWEAETIATRLDLNRAVAQLPETQREVLILRFVVGLTTEEISSVIGKERAAVYSLHARAIATLRKTLEEQ